MPQPPPPGQHFSPLPPAPAALSVPRPIQTPFPAGSGPDLYQRMGRRGYQQYPFGGYYGGGYYGADYGAPGYVDSGMQAEPSSLPPGWMRFESSPGAAQVFVDGFYEGNVDDFGFSGRALELSAGPHHVEVRAGGYATAAFDVNIYSQQTTRYRGDLERISAPIPAPTPAAPAALAAARKPTYVIPNCYAGNRKPVLPLPQGCDIKQLKVVE